MKVVTVQDFVILIPADYDEIEVVDQRFYGGAVGNLIPRCDRQDLYVRPSWKLAARLCRTTTRSRLGAGLQELVQGHRIDTGERPSRTHRQDLGLFVH